MNHDDATTKQRRLALGLLLLALAAAGLMAWRIGVPLLRFAQDPALFRVWVDGHGVWGRLAYMGMVIFQVVIALLPGEPFEIAAGYAFGAWEGTVLCLIASTAGSMLVFFLVRRFGQPLVQLFFSREKLDKLKFLRASAKRDMLLWLVFLLPGTPKDLICYFAGLTDVKPGLWLLICSVGRLPAILTSTLGGSALGTKQYWLAAGTFVATLAISGAGLLLYRHICRRNEQKP